jgi:hypothetical protein
VFEKFEQAWRTHDHGRKDNLQQELAAFLRELDNERRRNRIVLSLCGAYTLVTTIALVLIFSRRHVQLSEVWPLVAAQSIAFVALAWLTRMRLAKEREISANTSPVRDATAAALRSTEQGIRSVKLTAFSMLAILGLSAVALSSLYSSGKVDGRALSSLIPLFALIAIFNGSILWLKWTRKLRPRRERLSEMAGELDRE